ncbi:antitoxin [Rhizobium rhizosphaerae]|uniref:Antitoxin n=1 Tax=Xaviernesmea rhizosphaerae TaxID=1672749 RepID=A0A1Q9ADE3_9HYPH|nr:antitoxin Xre/MbcA/ParS toxin-binding domain-containing protein [Xaviernesmea rhizosphaerae]OLP52946.1 antitoxin [Xaviernesmea rhizosphaerae]
MVAVMEKKATASEAGGDLQKVARLLGGSRVLARRLSSPLDAHELLLAGLPASALDHLVGQLVSIDKARSLEKAVGMSLRTWQRRRDTPSKPLSREQSGRTWKFAEILSRATDVFGSLAEAEQWLERPATGLDQRRPIDLLATPAGVELVEDHLTRLEFGVYA